MIENEILEKLSNRTITYIRDDLEMVNIDNSFSIEEVEKIDYYDITTLISLSGSIGGTVGMSVSNKLAIEMVKNFIFGDMEDDELKEMSIENISETLNITLGNILPELTTIKNGNKVEISTPYTMHNSVTITKKKNGIMLLSSIQYDNDDKVLLSYFR